MGFSLDTKKITVFQWIIPRSNFPVKSAAADGSWTLEYKNIKSGKQPASLFKIPAGYKKFSLGGAFMSGTKTEGRKKKKKTVEKDEKKSSEPPVSIKKLLKKFW